MVTYPTRDGCSLGLDASSYQGPLEWQSLVDHKVRFVALKATEGLQVTDRYWAINAAAAQNFPDIKVVCPYHFMRPTLDPEAQAQHHYDVAHELATGRPVIDFETLKGCTRRQAATNLLRIVMKTEDLWQCDAIIYTASSYILDLLSDPVASEILSYLAARQLWIAAWSTKAPKLPKPWGDWCIWQFDGDGGLKLPDGKDADFDFIQCTEDQIAATIGRELTT